MAAHAQATPSGSMDDIALTAAPEDSARTARLRYVTDQTPGIWREPRGEEFTAKDFRTWEATVIVAHTLRHVGPAETKTATRQNEKQAIVQAAAHLGNTPTICTKSYVHPAMLEGYESGALLAANPARELARHPGLHPEEAEVLALLHAVAGEAATPQTRAG